MTPKIKFCALAAVIVFAFVFIRNNGFVGSLIAAAISFVFFYLILIYAQKKNPKEYDEFMNKFK
ncbi:hypothetical protein EF384_01820 [Aerococcus agrisoli]|uniref:Uncharacterized protein n=2 Tax=Aerococcus agrisoli TaxID=2487350 RepID=A0A3N4GLG7_9LACT|nr:hypothetical protein EF384_01820 [Aerococcus agrisoli]